jgi:hypothetical protein
VPDLTAICSLLSFPDESFRDFILMLLGMNLFATFAWDRLMQSFFSADISRRVLRAQRSGMPFGILKRLQSRVIMHVFKYSDQWDEMLALRTKRLTQPTRRILWTQFQNALEKPAR